MRQRHRAATLGVGLLAAGTLGLLVADALGAPVRNGLVLAPAPLAALLAAVACLGVPRRMWTRGGRDFWRGAGIAIALVGVGAALTLRANLRHPDSPQLVHSPTAAFAYIGALVIMLVALLRLPGRLRLTRQQQRQTALDGAILLTCAGLMSWRMSFRYTGAWEQVGGYPAMLPIVLLSGMAVLAIGKLTVFGIRTVNGRAIRALAVTIAAGAVIGAVIPLAPAVSAAVASVCVTLVSWGFTLAAGWEGGTGAEEPSRPSPLARLAGLLGYLPYAAVAVINLSVLALLAHHGAADLAFGLGAVVVTSIVVYRQVTGARDNDRLLRQVDATNQELEAAHSQLAHQATHDVLTGLANRRLFTHRLARSSADGGPAGVALIDLDDFKAVNDRLGHQLGDRLLVEVARRLEACVRPGDTVARLGGDEFALLLPGLTAARGMAVLDRITDALSQPVVIDGHALLVRCSGGLAPVEAHADPVELLRRADLAMYAAKEAGKARYACYDQELDVRANRDAQIGSDLRDALDDGHFRLLYQPVVRLSDRRVVGAEALVRWEHPQRGLIRPDHFIPVAERTGVIVPLGEWILREACREAVRWLADGVTGAWTMSVNISARQLREPGFAQTLGRVLDETGLPAAHLLVEVTETAVFDNDLAGAALQDISALGVSIALDDFGTGNSSLGLLRTIPVDVLKVDKSFIDHITESNAESTIAVAMLHLAHGLKLGVVAEGVESAAQATRLRSIGYELSQGYHFARPLPAEEVRGMLRAQERADGARVA